MSPPSRESPPIPHIYLPRRSVYGDDIVLRQPCEDILILQKSLGSRAAFLGLALVIGCLSSMFLYWMLQGSRFDEFRISDEKWLACGIACLGVLFSLAVALDTLFKGPIRIDRVRGTVARGGWIPGWWERELVDVFAVQVCRGKCDVIEGERGRDKITLQYQVNLVFRDSPLSRRNICEQKHRPRVERIGRRIADFLHVPLLNYVGPPGTMDAADAQARRLLAECERRWASSNGTKS